MNGILRRCDLRFSKFVNILVSIFLILAISVLKSASIWNYKHFYIDEEALVNFAVSFLGHEFNPKWFGYHTLPMYALYAVYEIIYCFYLLFGLVSTKVEYVSLLFINDSVFFVVARLVCSATYTTGLFVLAYIIWKKFNSKIAAISFFLVANIIPDSILAANEARVDSFVFLFLTLTIYFSCFAEKNHTNFVLATIFSAAAFCSKFPAIVIPLILFIKVTHDVFNKVYPKKHLLYFIIFLPICVFFFMPYAFLDFPSYRKILIDIFTRSSGQYYHIGKTHYSNISERLAHIYWLFNHQIGFISIIGTLLFTFLSCFRKKYFYLLLFVFVYAGTFTTSLTIDSHWYRPTYPFFMFFTFISIIFIASKESKINTIAEIYFPKNISILNTAALSLLLCITHIYLCKDNIIKTYHESIDHREDTRIISNQWIEQNLPALSRVWLEGNYVLYFPKVFAEDINIDIALRGSFTPDTEIITQAFYRYYINRSHIDKKYHVGILGAGPYVKTFVRRLELLKPGDYVIVSSYVYDRYYDAAINEFGAIAEDAKKYYSLLRRQHKIAHFEGKGPTITIYSIRDSFN